MDTKQVVAPFEAERQALALLPYVWLGLKGASHPVRRLNVFC
jgi:hypothetical protein